MVTTQLLSRPLDFLSCLHWLFNVFLIFFLAFTDFSSCRNLCLVMADEDAFLFGKLDCSMDGGEGAGVADLESPKRAFDPPKSEFDPPNREKLGCGEVEGGRTISGRPRNFFTGGRLITVTGEENYISCFQMISWEQDPHNELPWSLSIILIKSQRAKWIKFQSDDTDRIHTSGKTGLR